MSSNSFRKKEQSTSKDHWMKILNKSLSTLSTIVSSIQLESPLPTPLHFAERNPRISYEHPSSIRLTLETHPRPAFSTPRARRIMDSPFRPILCFHYRLEGVSRCSDRLTRAKDNSLSDAGAGERLRQQHIPGTTEIRTIPTGHPSLRRAGRKAEPPE